MIMNVKRNYIPNIILFFLTIHTSFSRRLIQSESTIYLDKELLYSQRIELPCPYYHQSFSKTYSDIRCKKNYLPYIIRRPCSFTWQNIKHKDHVKKDRQIIAAHQIRLLSLRGGRSTYNNKHRTNTDFIEDQDDDDKSFSSTSSRFLVSSYSVKGARTYMEDEYIVKNGGRFAAVFDGHGRCNKKNCLCIGFVMCYSFFPFFF